MGTNDNHFINTPTYLGQLDHHQGDNYIHSNENTKVLHQYMFSFLLLKCLT
jgi:hypothetical protein